MHVNFPDIDPNAPLNQTITTITKQVIPFIIDPYDNPFEPQIQ